MPLPINGRIAIIDDQINHAEPLIKVLSSKQLPVQYFSGDVKFLPASGNTFNDIRLLFLDINLIDDAEHNNTVLKARLLPVLNRVISANNYPYIIIYWSRHEHHRILIEDEIFGAELKDRKPIAYLSANKSSFFDFQGNTKPEFDLEVEGLFEKVIALVKQFPAYNYLLNWENQVHLSADSTLQRVFSATHLFQNWSDNANYLMVKFGKSFAGKAFDEFSASEKINSCFQAFNHVFIDTMEFRSNNTLIEDAVELLYDSQNVTNQVVSSINKNLLVSEETGPNEYSGAVVQDQNPVSDVIFNELLNNSVSRSSILVAVKADPNNNGKQDKEIKKLADKAAKETRDNIKANWKKVYCVVTPVCDYVQKKFANCRVVKGMLVESKFRSFLDDKSEAIFISPPFKFGELDYMLVLHFRYFFTANSSLGAKHLSHLFRIRQILLAEIQSKLARHISRQGILFLE